ncbi:hypothetical protein ACFX19_026132 [Malus domestica]
MATHLPTIPILQTQITINANPPRNYTLLPTQFIESLIPQTPVHKTHNSSAVTFLPANPHPQTPVAKCPTFALYLDTPDLPSKIRILCEILAKTHTIYVEERLEEIGVRVTQEDVEEVLKLSYRFPARS